MHLTADNSIVIVLLVLIIVSFFCYRLKNIDSGVHGTSRPVICLIKHNIFLPVWFTMRAARQAMIEVSYCSGAFPAIWSIVFFALAEF